MWSRKELKERAKAILAVNYWNAFLISIIIALAGGNNLLSGGNHHFNNSRHSIFFNFYHNSFIHWKVMSFSLSAILILLAIRIFIGYCLEVGGRKYFINSAQYLYDKKCFSFGFYEEHYLGIIKAMLATKILIFIWSLLLVIPGIIKSYSYRMVPYILADNPNIGVEKAISLSNEMTMGHKLDMFVLDLSFLGWYLLGTLAFGIGIFFVMPYDNATKAELYLSLRENALRNNLCSYNDLLL
ncbi:MULTISPECIES: DUF975 family protein [Clostridium]|jgi:uncharacterized membrane protein|uniref:DUF975 family protein n=1 Tax=Clostridium TaxID=1485 RepID=UPI000983C45B|nr:MULTISPECIES: DUF975 family protein [Clostridium]AQR95010.1 hypothetical protein CLSAP_23240 [Clostridium saccharoperbutylacetonicum]NSB30854.1 putative membrane protein [Clostridium saccharoperbutylacetonicum]